MTSQISDYCILFAQGFFLAWNAIFWHWHLWASHHSETSNKVYILFVYMTVSSFSKVLSNFMNFHFLILMSETDVWKMWLALPRLHFSPDLLWPTGLQVKLAEVLWGAEGDHDHTVPEDVLPRGHLESDLCAGDETVLLDHRVNGLHPTVSEVYPG